MAPSGPSRVVAGDALAIVVGRGQLAGSAKRRRCFTFRPPASRDVSPPAPRVPTYLTRRVTFAAAHRYRRPEWDEARNVRVFGPCAHPNYHGHSYTCQVTVRGTVDAETGFVADLGEIDRVLATEVRARFDHRNINLDVPEFADGLLVPSGENLARFICERVQHALGRTATVVRVTVAEDETLSATYEPDEGSPVG